MTRATIYQYWVLKDGHGCYYTGDCDWSGWRESAFKFATKASAFLLRTQCDERVYRVNCPRGIEIDLDDYV